jgi:hypothetical protein
MEFTSEATLAVNDYVDRVRLALPFSPSTRMAAADHLYHQIATDCADTATKAGQIVIGIDIVRDRLAVLGTSDECARRLADDHRAGAWQWPGDYFVGAFRHHRIGERAERVAQKSIDATAAALDIASKKLREAAERLKARDSS